MMREFVPSRDPFRLIVTDGEKLLKPACNSRLEIAVEAKAPFLVSGDDDLLALDPFSSVRIVHYRDFKEKLKRERVD